MPLLVLVLIFLFCFNANANARAEIQGLNALYTESLTIVSMEGQFEQTTFLSKKNTKLKSGGEFKYHKEKGLNWFVNQGEQSHVYVNANGVWQKQEHKEDRKIRGLEGLLFKSIYKAFPFSNQLEKDYEVQYVTEDENLRLQLKPKSNLLKRIIDQVHLHFCDLELKKIKVLYKNKDFKELLFHNVCKNHSLIQDE